MKEPTLTGRCNAQRLAMHLVVNKLLCPRLAYFPCFSTYEVTIAARPLEMFSACGMSENICLKSPGTPGRSDRIL